jgi:deoxyribonuclease V
MHITDLHPWNLDYAGAVAAQRALAGRVEAGPALDEVETIAGADVSGGKKDEWIVAAVVVMRLDRMQVVEIERAAVRAAWPYVPGCLSFREVPALAEAFRKLRTVPDLVLCDGQGFAHPRRMGLACHVGLVLGVPTIGCAKSRLIGEPACDLGVPRGSRAALMDGAERIGTVLRTRTGVKPLYVSVGHRIDLVSAERWVLAAAPRFRLPDPIRAAHRVVTQAKREMASH